MLIDPLVNYLRAQEVAQAKDQLIQAELPAQKNNSAGEKKKKPTK